MSRIKRTSHAVYDLKYPMVWVPKYSKMIGYFVRSVGDKVTSEVIRRYIKYQL